MSNKIIIIAGGGKFGKKALDYAQQSNYVSIIIDSDQECAVAIDRELQVIDKETLLAEWESLSPVRSYFLKQDISVLFDLLEINAEYIIPVVPVHLMAQLIESLFLNYEFNLKPDQDRMEFILNNIQEDIILGSDKKTATIYLSHAKATEICPDDCPGPPDYCPTFNREKPFTITRYVKDFFYILDTIKIHSNDMSSFDIAIESKQLAPGLGGLLGAEVKFVFNMIKEKINNSLISRINLMISTTCNCHGVINFYKSD